MYIINADDFGISTENNLAVLEAAKFGILNSTSVMVNTPYFDENIFLFYLWCFYYNFYIL